MIEKTFEELIEEKLTLSPEGYVIYSTDIKELLEQVREATKAEIENKANEYSEYGTADYVHEMPTDRILTP